MAHKKTRPGTRIFYGWYVLAAAFLILFFNSGARFAIGVIFKPMISEFGWTRGSISFAVFMNMAFFALSVSVVGRFYDRYGPKWVIIISTLFLSIGYASVSGIQSIFQFTILYGVLSGIGLGGTSVPLFAAIVSKWFKKHRGLAISLALSGNCLGQFALVPLITSFVIAQGWRTSYFLMGLVILIMNVILVLVVLRGEPEDLGYRPYGSQEAGKNDVKGSGNEVKTGAGDLGLKEAMRTRSYWSFVVLMFVCGSGDFLVTTHLIPMVTDHGISASSAGNMLAWFGLMSLFGILVAGPASDRIGNKLPIALTFGLRVLLFILIWRYKTPFTFYLFSLAFGFTFLITAPLTPTLIGRLYGLSHVGLLGGFVTTIHHVGGGFGAYLGGLIFDRQGSYQTVFVISAMMAVIAVLCSVLIREQRHLPQG